jgi:Leucine-rich repeat (LRR) protein
MKVTPQSNFFSYLSRALNANNFSGKIPPSFGNLTELKLLDLADNQLSGPLPISAKDGSGLDQLRKTGHLSVPLTCPYI